jgi:hypothetical protein
LLGKINYLARVGYKTCNFFARSGGGKGFDRKDFSEFPGNGFIVTILVRVDWIRLDQLPHDRIIGNVKPFNLQVDRTAWHTSDETAICYDSKELWHAKGLTCCSPARRQVRSDLGNEYTPPRQVERLVRLLPFVQWLLRGASLGFGCLEILGECFRQGCNHLRPLRLFEQKLR